MTTYDSQKFDADMYEAEAGLVKIEYILDGFQSHTLVIEGMEEDFKLEVGDEKTDLGEIELNRKVHPLLRYSRPQDQWNGSKTFS